MRGSGRASGTVLLGGAMLLSALACGGATEGTGSVATERTADAPTQEAPQDAAATAQDSRPVLTPLPTHDSTSAGLAGSAPSGDLTWTAPKEWIEETPKSAMRKAQYRLPAAPGDREDGECVVYYFGAGQGGEVKANLDRWADQFRGFGTTAPKFSEMKAGGFTISRAEARGTYTPSPMSMGGGPEPEPKPGFMLLGAIVPGPDANWFFKCTGPEKTMEANRARFDGLLASVSAGR